jgi:hypothetical protein
MKINNCRNYGAIVIVEGATLEEVLFNLIQFNFDKKKL